MKNLRWRKEKGLHFMRAGRIMNSPSAAKSEDVVGLAGAGDVQIREQLEATHEPDDQRSSP
jgi:hypothetical protein